MHRTICALMILALATPIFAQQPDPVVATINGEVLYKSDLEKLWLNMSPQMRKQYELSGGKIAFLDNYITKRLILQEALKDDFHLREDVRFQLEQARDQALFDAYVREEISSLVVPEAEIRSRYEANLARYRTPERVRARHIVVSPSEQGVANRTGSNATSEEAAREKIREIADQLTQKPEAFADLAMRYSEDGSAESGGDLGWFPRGRMVSAFDEVVFSLEPGEVSEPFQTEFGWHIALVEEKLPAGIRPYEDVRAEIREELLASRTRDVIRQIESLSTELRNVSQVSINRENL